MKFLNKDLLILVSTFIEVGIDFPKCKSDNLENANK